MFSIYSLNLMYSSINMQLYFTKLSLFIIIVIKYLNKIYKINVVLFNIFSTPTTQDDKTSGLYFTCGTPMYFDLLNSHPLFLVVPSPNNF